MLVEYKNKILESKLKEFINLAIDNASKKSGRSI